DCGPASFSFSIPRDASADADGPVNNIHEGDVSELAGENQEGAWGCFPRETRGATDCPLLVCAYCCNRHWARNCRTRRFQTANAGPTRPNKGFCYDVSRRKRNG